MEQRGPAAHAEGWDAAMLLSCRGILVCPTFLLDYCNKAKDKELALSPGQVTEPWECLPVRTNGCLGSTMRSILSLFRHRQGYSALLH